MGLTRARVYQLLNEINDIVMVRWPHGRHQAHELRDRIDRESEQGIEAPTFERFQAALELFYPGNRRGAAGSVEGVAAGRASLEQPVTAGWTA